MLRTGWVFGARKPYRKASARSAYRPVLEGLEDRCLLSAVETAAGFSAFTTGHNDDGVAGPIAIGFDAQLGSVPSTVIKFNQLYINNNGNVTIGGPNGNYGAIDFNTTPRTVFGPFVADIDTRNSNAVVFGNAVLNGHNAFAVTWPGVGYYNQHNDKLNSFQVVFIDRSDTGPGNFDVEFNYDQVQWEGADSSLAQGGLGGFSPAVVGFSAGTQQPGTTFTFTGSGIAGTLLDSNPVTGLIHNSRNSDVLGRYVFSFRAGVLDNNHPPVANAGGPYSVAEGGSLTLNASASSDADPGDTLTYSWDLNGDGVYGDATGVAPTLNWAQLQSLGINDGPATFNARVQVNDGHGPVISAPVTLSVTNTPPTLTLSGAFSVDENTTFTLNLSSSDPGQDTVSGWTINWGDGNVQTVAGNPSSVTHTYAHDAGDVVISATATDEDGTYAAGNTLPLHVNSFLPSPTLTGNTSVDEGSTYTLTLASNAPASAPISGWTIAWGDGSTTTISGDATSATHTYADGANDYTISASATNMDGTFPSLDNVAVHINNVAPTLVLSGAASIDEGSTYTLNLSSRDPGPDTITGWTINWGDGTFQSVSGNPTSLQHFYAQGPNDFTIFGTATDEDGTYSSNTVALHVNHVPPTLTISGAATVDQDGIYTLNLGANVRGQHAILSWTINWGDGTIETLPGNPSSATHVYIRPGDYQITASATDDTGTTVTTRTADAVTVNDVPPTLDFSGAGTSVDEGAVYVLTLKSTDVGKDVVDHWTVTWGDGTVQTVFVSSGTVTHVYADGPNDYTISATATDPDGTYPAGNTVAVHVNPLPPVVTLSGAGSVDEGSTYTLSLAASDADHDAIASWTINWGDGNFQIISGDPGSVTHVYADGANDFSISATATDVDGVQGSSSLDVHVNNVPPTLSLSGAASVDEGSAYFVTLSSSDAGQDTIASWTINWGDGSVQTISGNPGSASHTYADGPADFTISATATDEDGSYAAANTVAVHVNNVAPTLTLSGAASVDEASAYTLALSASDPGQDTISGWTINWGDGSSQSVSGNPASLTHTYADGPNDYTISATAADEDGTYAANTLAVHVNAVPPKLTLSGASSVNEGDTYTLNLTASEVGQATITSWSIRWGDGNVQSVAGNPSSVTHVYADGPNTFTITADATDKSGTHAAPDSVAVTVNNIAPTLTLSGAASVDAGNPYTLNLSSSDPGQDTISSWSITWGDGSVQTVAGNPSSVTHSYANGNADYTISATAIDEDGTYDAGNTVGVHVNSSPIGTENSAPVIGDVTSDALKVGSAAVGSSVTVSASFTDADVLDTHTAIIQWGDGTTSDATISESGGAGSLSGSHAYATGGQFTITVTLSDNHGGIASGATTALVSGVGVVDGTLYVIGTPSNDQVHISKKDEQLKVQASFLPGNHVAFFSLQGVERIVVRLGGGNDEATIANNVHLPVLLDGGWGDDVLQAGGGPTIVMGGAGNDLLLGGKGRDLIIGGTGADVLYGGANQNILIGGTTQFDKKEAALWAVLQEWNSSRSREARIANLSGTGTGKDFEHRLNGNNFLNADTVKNDDAVNVLIARNLDSVFAKHKDWVWKVG